jgi:ketosteroid isomerase-like protein
MTMKGKPCFLSRVLAVIFMMILSGCGNQIVNNSKELQIVQACSDSLLKAESELNAEAAMKYYAEDAIVQGPGTPQIQGKMAIAEMYRQFFGTSQLKEFSVKLTYINLSKSGDVAYEYGTNRVVMSTSQNDLMDVGKYTLVWRKFNDKWLVVILAFSNDNPEPMVVGEK